MTAMPLDLSVVVVNWNTRDLLAECLTSLAETHGALALEVWVVDNGSSDGSREMVREQFPRVKVISNSENVGFVRANNQALARCRGRYALLLNSDTQVLPGSLEGMVHFMDDHPAAGVAGVRLLNTDGSFQASWTPFPTLWREFLILSGLGRWLIRPFYPSKGPQTRSGPRPVDGYVEGACLMARREAMEQVGGLDERIFMYAEEVDWCYRFRQARWDVWYLPQTPIIHHGGQSSKKRGGRMEAELYRSRIYFFHKHYGPGAASVLKMLIYGMTLVKIAVHRILAWVTRGYRGRAVTTWADLRRALHGVDVAHQRSEG